MTENLDVFLTDFGVPVVFGAINGLGILDMPDQELGNGLSISADISLLVKASVFGALKYNDAVTVNGTSYVVKEFRLMDDGSFGRAYLKTP